MPLNNWHRSPPSLEQALRKQYSVWLQHLAHFLGSIEWWRLEPDESLVLDLSDDWSRRIVAARTPEGDLAVAFVPGVSSVRLNTAALQRPLQVAWFDPIQGQWRRAKEQITESGVAQLATPEGWAEALLLLGRLQA